MPFCSLPVIGMATKSTQLERRGIGQGDKETFLYSFHAPTATGSNSPSVVCVIQICRVRVSIHILKVRVKVTVTQVRKCRESALMPEAVRCNAMTSMTALGAHPTQPLFTELVETASDTYYSAPPFLLLRAMLSEHIGNGRIRYVISDIRECTSNHVVAPVRILFCKTNKQVDDLLTNPRSIRLLFI